MASQIVIKGLARVIDETILDDSTRLGIARRVADVLEADSRDFARDKFIDEATKTKRALVRA